MWFKNIYIHMKVHVDFLSILWKNTDELFGQPSIMDYYSTINKNKMMPFTGTSVDLENNRILSEVGASLLAPLVKNLPAMWETWVRSPGWEDPLEKGTAIHSSILAWRMLWIL